MKLTFFILLIALCTSQGSYAQMSFSEIHLSEIPYPKVRSYIDNQKRNSNFESLSELKPSCENKKDYNGFCTYKRRYKVKGDIQKVWETYLNASPTDSWKTRKSAVGLVYNRKSDSIVYSNDSNAKSQIGQVLFLDLRLLKGFYHLATAVEITDIQSETSTIEISYVESGVNEGKQWIIMNADDNGNTIITHTSSIKSNSRFRDKFLYPYFHNRVINAFHRKMRRSLNDYSVDSRLEYAID
ncbi:hypothetical protein N8Z47_00115 [Salibacteraceae bacterium]|nr:hypothetical protein [Salibacteraceae bacterium]